MFTDFEDSQAEVRARVALCAAEFDEQLPGWEAYVSIGALDMTDGDLCLAGQLGDRDPRLRGAWTPEQGVSVFSSVVRYLAQDTDHLAWAQRRGLYTARCCYDCDGVPLDGITYTELHNGWVELLTQRQARFAVKPGSTPEPTPMTDAEDRAFSDAYQERGVFQDPEVL